ncbi:hypothetical protein [Micromonospora sp. C51]|nr:hypothetical protein [Micromonospora sp. C51]
MTLILVVEVVRARPGESAFGRAMISGWLPPVRGSGEGEQQDSW